MTERCGNMWRKHSPATQPEGIYKEIKAVYKRNRRQRILIWDTESYFATGNEGKMREIRLYIG